MDSKKIFLATFLLFVCASIAIAIALPGRPLSNSEMRTFRGRGMEQFSGCCEEDLKTECNYDDECIYCDHVTDADPQCKTADLDDPAACMNDGKNYAEADYTKCKVAKDENGDVVDNGKECSDNGSMDCWTEYNCTDGGVENDKCCKDNVCVTMNEDNCAGVDCAKCRECTESSTTTGNVDSVDKQQCS